MPTTPNWTGPWDIATTYNAGDLVSYANPAGNIYFPGVSTWISLADSNAGNQPGSTSAWDLFASAGQNGINAWRGTWSSVIPYSAFDAVVYNGSSYISLINANSGNIPSSSPSQWAVLASAGGTGPAGSFTFLGVWSSSATYVVNNIVAFNGSSYAVSGTPTMGVNPATDTANWQLIASVGATGTTGAQGPQGPIGLGFDFRGAWSSSTSYHLNDVVSLLGSSYVAVTANTGVNPSTDGGTNWQLMVQAGAPSQYLLPPVATVSRPLPSSVPAGTQYYDLTLSIPLWSDGTVWRDASGTTH